MINLGISPFSIFSNFNSSLMLEFDDPLLLYSSCITFDASDAGPAIINFGIPSFPFGVLDYSLVINLITGISPFYF